MTTTSFTAQLVESLRRRPKGFTELAIEDLLASRDRFPLDAMRREAMEAAREDQHCLARWVTEQ